MHGGLCAVQPHADVWQPHGLTISARSEVLLHSHARSAGRRCKGKNSGSRRSVQCRNVLHCLCVASLSP